jgi:hypothetical protein
LASHIGKDIHVDDYAAVHRRGGSGAIHVAPMINAHDREAELVGRQGLEP